MTAIPTGGVAQRGRDEGEGPGELERTRNEGICFLTQTSKNLNDLYFGSPTTQSMFFPYQSRGQMGSIYTKIHYILEGCGISKCEFEHAPVHSLKSSCPDVTLYPHTKASDTQGFSPLPKPLWFGTRQSGCERASIALSTGG